MRRTHRLSARVIRWTSLCVCFALILASLTLITPVSSGSGLVPQGRNGQPNNGKAKRVTPAQPLPGAPAASLPSLEEAHQRRNAEPEARQPVPSTMRSRRKPVESRQGRKVGDRLPVLKVSINNSGSGSGRLAVALKEGRSGARSHHARRAPALNVLETPLPQGGSAQNVVWTNTVGVSVSGNDLTKTAAQGWGNAGAVSTQAIASGDGYVEFTASETGAYRLCGLSRGDTDQNYPDIDFGLDIGAGHVYIYESGVYRGDFGTFATGDQFRVAVEGGVVKYSRNGTVLYTSTVTPIYPLLVDTSLFQSGSTLTNVVISGNLSSSLQNVIWTNVVGVSATGNNLTKTAATTWGNAGAVSTQAIASGDGYVEFTASETSTYRVCGLSRGDTDPNYSDIDFGFDIGAGHIYIYESGVSRGDFGGFATGDHLRVAVEGGVVKYSRNGTALYTSTVTPIYPLLVDTSLFQNGSTLTNVVISGNLSSSLQNVIWANVVGVSATGNNLTKTAATTWGNAGAVSTQAIASGDGYVEFTASETGAYRVCGLSRGDTDQNYSDIDFGFDIGAGHIYIYESGVYRGDFGGFATGDHLRVAVEGGVVKYSRNGAVLYTSTVTPIYPLLVDTSLFQNGSTLTSVVISGNLSGGAFADSYTENFVYWALSRPPSADEVIYWEDILRAAYAHGQGSMMIAVREMARSIFESADYAARGRNNHEYVNDLYKTYLRRNPDALDWTFWEGQCNSYGREQVRRAFDECGEFAGNVAAITPNGSASTAVSSLLSARVDPNNQTGNQLLARDAEWGMPLLSLRGRAGLDLGLGLSYSSAAVWTRSGPYSYFDEDNGTLSPGFRLGFPTVQEVFFDAQAGVNARVLIAPSGHRVELRQVGASNVYEAADSSYLQLIDYGGSLLVRSTDGTQMSYVKRQDEWRCTQIEDRNGNLISVSNNDQGDITSITDTVGRVITFNYDGNANLISITQPWGGQTHTWATFGWGNLSMQPNLTGVVGTHSGDVIPVLTQVGLDDGSSYAFEYNGNGQVSLIRRYTSDNVQRSYMGYNYALSAEGSPRLTDQRVWAENWTGGNGIPNEVVTYFSDPGDGSHVMTTPHGTIYKEFYGGGWQRGLTVRTEVWAGGAEQKVTTTAWVQDNQNANYQTNPRVTETNVYDSVGNRRRATVEYNQGYGLPTHVREYGGSGGQTLLRLTTTAYKGDAVYIDRRIIGLPYERIVYDGPTGNLMSRQIFHYDWGDPYFSTQAPATNYDAANYPSWFIVGRGNLVAVRRYSCENNSTAYDENQASWVQLNGYNMAGSLLWTQDAASHRTSLSYSDSFSDGNNGRGTFAYPTTLTDADGYSSSVQYNYDFGAKTRVQGPPPANQSIGIVQTFSYDNAIRLQQVTTANNNAYTRYVYGPNYTQSFSTVNNIADDAYSVQVFDGAGRVFAAATSHPGSVGGYSAVYTIYDVMGRVFKQSNPTEMNGSWVPSGDDAAGWIYTQQTYDWKGRPLLTSHLIDGTTKQTSYSACGCAGSDIVTLTDEVGRQQKVYSDVLGRTAKTEVLNWNSTVYATTVNTYNAADQVTLTRQFHGTDQSSVYQDTTMSYDGYGRLQTKHVPEQNYGTATVYVYNADDTIYSITDARGASATYSYNNNRRLVSGINYTTPSGVTPTSSVSLGYDAVGNRTSMTDGTGSMTYQYNQLSQLTSETRQFSGSGTPSGNFTLAYEYNLANQVKSVSDQRSGTSFSTVYDGTGRVNSVSAVGYGGGVTQFASQAQYRAWGALKAMTYGNNTSLTLGYDPRGFVTGYSSAGMGAAYQYYSDGKPKFAQDQNSELIKDRAFSYDHAGRLAEAYSGTQARDFINNTNSGITDGPFRQSYNYDAWDNMLGDSWRFWSRTGATTATYNSSNRNPAWSYDADGNLLSRESDGAQYGYDAAGNNVTKTSAATFYSAEEGGYITNIFNDSQRYDADGQLTHYIKTRSVSLNGGPLGVATQEHVYNLRSTVLGGAVISEYNAQGTWNRSYVYAGGERIGEQTKAENGLAFNFWRHVDPVIGDEMKTNSSGGSMGQTILDPQGVDVGREDPFPANGSGDPDGIPNGGEPIGRGAAGLLPIEGGGTRCVLDGISMDCSFIKGEVSVQCPNNDCSPRRWDITTSDGKHESGVTNPFQAFADGTAGFLPAGWLYTGDGVIFNSDWTGGASEKMSFDDIEEGSMLDAFSAYYTAPKNGLRRRRGRARSPRAEIWGDLTGGAENFRRSGTRSVPKDPPSSNSGYLDVNGGASWPIWGPIGAGPMGGTQLDSKDVYLYFGGQLTLPPGATYSAMYSPDSVSPGLNVELSGTTPFGGVSGGTDAAGNTFGSFGRGSLGVQLSVYYVMGGAIPKTSRNCACNAGLGNPPPRQLRYRHLYPGRK